MYVYRGIDVTCVISLATLIPTKRESGLSVVCLVCCSKTRKASLTTCIYGSRVGSSEVPGSILPCVKTSVPRLVCGACYPPSYRDGQGSTSKLGHRSFQLANEALRCTYSIFNVGGLSNVYNVIEGNKPIEYSLS